MTDLSLSERVVQGDPRAVARAISLFEDEAPAGAELIRRIFPRTGGAYLVGVDASCHAVAQRRLAIDVDGERLDRWCERHMPRFDRAVRPRDAVALVLGEQ